MKLSFRKGISFGLTTAIITTLALMVGLNASTNSATVVIAGIFVIAVADALSDSLGMHISEEAEYKHSNKEVWESTLATFGAKFIVASTFLLPMLLLPLQTAITLSVVWGLLLITVFSFFVARHQKKNVPWTITEHLVLAVFIIFVTHSLGTWLATVFG
jgi:VIT1/CCC1 family predicted Fe2+/Mn2+ transporter